MRINGKEASIISVVTDEKGKIVVDENGETLYSEIKYI